MFHNTSYCHMADRSEALRCGGSTPVELRVAWCFRGAPPLVSNAAPERFINRELSWGIQPPGAEEVRTSTTRSERLRFRSISRTPRRIRHGARRGSEAHVPRRNRREESVRTDARRATGAHRRSSRRLAAISRRAARAGEDCAGQLVWADARVTKAKERLGPFPQTHLPVLTPLAIIRASVSVHSHLGFPSRCSSRARATDAAERHRVPGTLDRFIRCPTLRRWLSSSPWTCDRPVIAPFSRYE